MRDNVDILAGFALTPNALAAADVSAQAKKFMVVMNAATAIITTKSPYMARTSFTVPQLNETLGTWADKNGDQKRLHHGLRLWSGHRRRRAFQKGFKDAGGEIVGSVRMPGAESGLLRLRAARQGPQPARHFHLDPGRRAAGAFGKALAERGIDPKKTEVLGQGDSTEEDRSRAWATLPIGIITVGHYDYNHQSDAEQGVREGLQRRVQAAIPTSSRSAAMTACT